MSRVRAGVPLHNQRPVPPGAHHDVDRPLPVTVLLRWATGTETLDTVALEWTPTLVRVRIADLRVMTGAVWLPAPDVRRRDPAVRTATAGALSETDAGPVTHPGSGPEWTRRDPAPVGDPHVPSHHSPPDRALGVCGSPAPGRSTHPSTAIRSPQECRSI